jgi:hypothetical protein
MTHKDYMKFFINLAILNFFLSFLIFLNILSLKINN